MRAKFELSLTKVQLAMLVLGAFFVLFIWCLFWWHSSATRTETLNAKLSENRNLALIVSESLKQVTNRAKAFGGLVGENFIEHSKAQARLLELLVDDPVFKQLSIYDDTGALLYTSHPGIARPNIADWVVETKTLSERTGLMPALPSRATDPYNESGEPARGLPLLFSSDSGVRRESQAILVELDADYLVGLLKHVKLGAGFVQILDSSGDEWMRADQSGILVGGPPVPRIEPAKAGQVVSGSKTVELATQRFQYVFVTRPTHGFSVGIVQPHEEILAPLENGHTKLLVANILMSLLVIGVILWLIRSLTQQQTGLEALRLSEKNNRKLIERLEAEHSRSSRAAAIDHLSGLFNRRQFLTAAESSLLDQRRRRKLTTMLFIDLDRFKSINDSLGHHIGDLLLQAVAGRIQHMLSDVDIAARFGGDEFVVLLNGDRSERQIEQWAAELTNHLSAPYMLEGTELKTSPSIGIAISPRDGESVDELTRCADAAMYSAKKAGRGQYKFFDQSLNVTDVEEFHLEQAFPEALTNGEFILHYQPQVSLETMQVVGYEALIRWQHPDFGLLYPDRFIPVAEKAGFIIPMGMEVLRLACAQIVSWRREQGGSLPIAVNVSPIQLAEPNFCEDILALISDFGVKTNLLELEITETSMLEKQAVENLQALKKAGIKLSLDDFGTGYAGFAHLESAALDKLKIDRSLINKISNSHNDSPIVSSTIVLAKRLNLKVVAEGVESKSQLVHLKVAGCDVAQGYYLGRPMPAKQIPDYLSTFSEKEASA